MGFDESYGTAAARWPEDTTSLDVPTSWGRTHVLAAGPAGAPALVLLHGGDATATAWADVARELSGRFRVLAPDQPGSPGRSTSSRPFRTPSEMAAWLAELLAALDVGRVHLVGHSAGAHLALSAALDGAPAASLSLLDPTACFAGFSPRYLLRAAPHLVRPTPDRVRRFLAWETGGRELDPAWLDVVVRGSTEFASTPIVRTRRPSRAQLTRLTVPTLVLVAGRSRAHDPSRVARNARLLLPDATVVELPGASHHTVPVLDAAEIAAAVGHHVVRSTAG